MYVHILPVDKYCLIIRVVVQLLLLELLVGFKFNERDYSPLSSLTICYPAELFYAQKLKLLQLNVMQVNNLNIMQHFIDKAFQDVLLRKSQ